MDERRKKLTSWLWFPAAFIPFYTLLYPFILGFLAKIDLMVVISGRFYTLLYPLYPSHWDFLHKISVTLLLYHPWGCFGSPEKQTSLRNYNLFVWSAVFQPKLNDIQKTYKNYQNPLKNYCFLKKKYYPSLFNFSGPNQLD